MASAKRPLDSSSSEQSIAKRPKLNTTSITASTTITWDVDMSAIISGTVSSGFQMYTFPGVWFKMSIKDSMLEIKVHGVTPILYGRKIAIGYTIGDSPIAHATYTIRKFDVDRLTVCKIDAAEKLSIIVSITSPMITVNPYAFAQYTLPLNATNNSHRELNDTSTSDVEFKFTTGETIPAHRFPLITQSSRCKTQLAKDGMWAKDNIITVDAAVHSVVTIKRMLDAAYSIGNAVEKYSLVDIPDLVNLFNACNEYGFHGIGTMCAISIASRITVESFTDIYRFHLQLVKMELMPSYGLLIYVLGESLKTFGAANPSCLLSILF